MDANEKPFLPDGWVLLSYSVPRVPSSPRVSVWRKLQRLGVAQLSDGLVALPADARTREHLDWIAAEILDAGGSATVWLGHPAAHQNERDIAESMTAERRTEYCAVISEAHDAHSLTASERTRAAKRLREQLRRIDRRDYFPPVERDQAVAAVAGVASGESGTATAAIVSRGRELP